MAHTLLFVCNFTAFTLIATSFAFNNLFLQQSLKELVARVELDASRLTYDYRVYALGH